MKKFIFSLFLLVCFLGWSAVPVFAQNYQFRVDSSVVNLKINKDGTASVEYTLQFVNDNSAAPIDAIDIGVPTDNYDMSSVKAEVGGQSVTDISESPYVKPGVALNLGRLAIDSGQRQTVHVVIGKVSGLLHPGTAKESESYASFQFSPSWFDSQYVHGTTAMTVTITFPPGVKPEEPRYFNTVGWPGNNDPLTGLDSQNQPYYQWQYSKANSSTKYIFGGSFPARVVPAAAITSAPVELPGFLNSDNFCCGIFVIGFIAVMWFISWASSVSARKRKLQYLPPRISVEGHGIKRGLTAVEAAVLMEQPPDKVFTMILFSVVKKGAATVTERNPLKIKVADTLPEGLRAYEIEFLNAFKNTAVVDQRKALQELMIKLIKFVTDNMKGFSSKETVAYYKSINEKAWEMIKTADTPDVQMKFFDEAMDWSMMSDDFNQRAQQTYVGRPIFLPLWWGAFDPTYHPMGGGLQASMPSSGGNPMQVSLPTLPGADFAASMVNGVQNFSGHILGDLTNFTGGVTDKTNPVPVTHSSYHGGGGGCACACACAGCACACAGGGR